MTSNFLKEIKILIVEDDKEQRESLVSTLKRYFNTILEAEDAEHAFEIYKLQSDVNLIISKINLPNMDGLELLNRVRQNNLNLPFIFITERTDSETILNAVNLNVDYYMLKPVDINDLLQKIDFVCERLFLQKRLDDKQKEIENYIESVDNVALIFKMYEDGQIFYMNKSMHEISGYDQKDLINLNFMNIVHPSVSKKMLEDTWNSIKSGELYKGDTKFISKTKDEFYLNSTVFKNHRAKDEYITVAFLTTQENLKKRDFHKKVLQSIQQANKKESELKNIINDLSKRIKDQENFVLNYNHQLELEKKRAVSRERQLNHYELQMENLNQKNEKLIVQKNEEVQSYIDSAEEKKRKMDLQSKELKKYKKELTILREKYSNLEKEIAEKNYRITHLLDLLRNKHKEEEKQAV